MQRSTKALGKVIRIDEGEVRGHLDKLVRGTVEETFTYYSFPSQHWIKLKTNNPMERLLCEARRRTKVVGAFPDGQSALMLVAARLRHVSTTQWRLRKYVNVGLLKEMAREVAFAAA